MTIEISKIRNVGVVGHGGVGKTSLVESMLFSAGATTRLGRVDDGTTITDFDPDEIKRKISLTTAVAHCDWKGHHINFVDTPGYGDFIADARAGLRVVEAALVVVDAVAGVQVQTEKVWKFATEYDLPRAIVVNRLDRERADFDRTLDSLQRRLKGRIVPLMIPVGEEAGFKGYIDLGKMKAFVYAEGGKSAETDIPGDYMDRAREYREKLVEAAAETDDELLAKYLEEGSLDDDTMLKAMRRGITEGKIIPVMCAAATKSIGSHPLLEMIIKEFPSPADRPDVTVTDLKAKKTTALTADPKGHVGALVFKTLADPHIGKLSLFRVYSGTVKADSTLLNPGRGTRERMGHISWLQGKTQKNVTELGPGEIGVVQKLKETLTGDTLCEEAHPLELPRIPFAEPTISFAIQPKTRGDEDKISNALSRLAEEDPTLHYHFDPETKQLLVSGVGSMHVEMSVERMKRKYNVDVTLLPPRIPYKETVKGRAETQGKYKKQTGGRGQYGDTWLRIEPMPRGGGFSFVDDVFGGAVPRNFIPSVEKGVRDCMKRGILAGYPVVDLKVTLYDGSYHDVDSSDMAFQIAASMGLQKGFMDAHPILLEPIMHVEVTTPADHAGDVIGDLNSRRGRIVGMEPNGETALVRASVPMAEMLTYEPSLRSMTGGRGGYSMEFSHYEEVPASLADKVVKEAKIEKEKADKH
jgi:elongation factor G